MTAVIIDITPKHEPLALARKTVTKIEESGDVKAMFVVLLRDDDAIQYDGACDQKATLLWALERLKLDLLTEETQ